MKARFKAGLGLLTLILSVSTAHAQIFLTPPAEIWAPIYSSPPAPGDIINELFLRNYQAAWRLAKDLAIIEARKQAHKFFQSKVNMTKLAATLNKIIDDPGKTQVQKEDDLLQVTDAALEPTTSPSTGALNVTMQHSIELGVTRLEWDDKVRYGSCSGGMVSTTCKGTVTGSGWSCSSSGAYSTVYYRSQPHYIISRIVNGQEKVITKFAGSLENSGPAGFAVTGNLWSTAWSAAKYYYNSQGKSYRDVVPGRAFFYDFNADMHNPGDTLSYKIVSTDDFLIQINPPNNVPCGVGTGSVISTIAVADGDGNGRMDYLTNADYAKYFKKYYGWLPAMINSVLD